MPPVTKHNVEKVRDIIVCTEYERMNTDLRFPESKSPRQNDLFNKYFNVQNSFYAIVLLSLLSFPP